MKVFTAQQMRDFDKAATEEFKIPSVVLMENAALRVVEFLEMKFSPLKGKRVLVLCGKGNNGGDGFAIARHLDNAGCIVGTGLVAGANEPDGLKGDALTQFTMMIYAFDGYSDEMDVDLSTDSYQLERAVDICGFDLFVDALLGTGFSGEPHGNVRNGLYALEAIKRIRRLNSYQKPIIAVDIPSALNADSGEAIVKTVRADYTVTFAGPKRGMFLRDGIEKCGEVWLGSIGTAHWLMQEHEWPTNCHCITREKAQSLLPRRPLDAHKGDAGRALLIGGSFGMSGAPTLAARAVLKSGAGLCIAALPDKIISTFAAAFSEATSHPLPCDEKGMLIESAADNLPALWNLADAVAIGPGIGRAGSTLDFVRRVARECPQPLIIDADALYALRAIESDLKKRGAATILTPHPGEMGELMEMKTEDVNDNRIETAIACAQKYNAVVVLKGARSIVALPDGNTHINLTGNAGMATGGSGDVLTGTIVGLLAQNKDAKNATLLGVYLHGMAGDLAFETLGNGLIAGDIEENIPRALVELSKPIEPSANARLRKLE